MKTRSESNQEKRANYESFDEYDTKEFTKYLKESLSDAVFDEVSRVYGINLTKEAREIIKKDWDDIRLVLEVMKNGPKIKEEQPSGGFRIITPKDIEEDEIRLKKMFADKDEVKDKT